MGYPVLPLPLGGPKLSCILRDHVRIIKLVSMDGLIALFSGVWEGKIPATCLVEWVIDVLPAEPAWSAFLDC